MTNYFEFFELKEAFFIDEKELFSVFINNTKKFHPDHASEEDQMDSIENTSTNNKAYSVLKSFDKRLDYLLELKGISAPENKKQLSHSFLMEMMELNEELEKAVKEKKQEILSKIDGLKNEVLSNIKIKCTQWDEKPTPELLEIIYNMWLELKYFKRLLN